MVALDQVEIIGAGPAGLYTGILLKTAWPRTRVRVTERNPDDATFGFGVVFSEQALDFLEADDVETHAWITPHMERWRDITLSLKGTRITLDGIGFAAIGRLQLLKILQLRARDCGVEMRFDRAVDSLDGIEADLVVGADGLNSVVRGSDPDAFAPTLEYCANRFAWFGAPREYPNLTQTFISTPRGVLNAHHYRYATGQSTFVVECDPESFDAYGFDELDEAESARVCADLFADALDGAPLLINHSHWRQFPRLWCERWAAGNRVILGDAAHTAHFSIGSGTRLALEDAIALAAALREETDLQTALDLFQARRMPIARKIVAAAAASAAWYDRFREHMRLPPMEFAHSYLMRSGRVDDERMRRMSPGFMHAYAGYRKTIERRKPR